MADARQRHTRRFDPEAGGAPFDAAHAVAGATEIPDRGCTGKPEFGDPSVAIPAQRQMCIGFPDGMGLRIVKRHHKRQRKRKALVCGCLD
jgi:hypothetical protein